ncbi:MAG: phosphate transport system regulatory protein PhoU [spirochete symbiont of Stewartia floridana]|nr:MAG: phosphate transport system regulatory protein PhoU [spirochete symbiont of Stewartia floridana]
MNKAHTDKKYENELVDIRQNLLMMAGRVEDMISRAIEALINQDIELAKNTIESDHVVNRHEIEIDEQCLLVLTKWQPVASDLRFITLALKMVTDLERIGDLNVNICERIIDLGTQRPILPYIDIQRMTAVIQTMIHDAIDAFVESDPEKAQDVVNRDDEVDDLYHKVFRDKLSLMMQDEANIRKGIHILSIAKMWERMADHCTNLAEQVIFMVRGKDIRHIK